MQFVEKLSNHVRMSLLARNILELGFVAPRARVRRYLAVDRELTTLDLGCGAGILAGLFTKGRYVGVDVNARFVAYARKKQRGEFLVGDARELGLADGRFDQVLIFGVFHHLPDEGARSALGEALRVLTKGGRILAMEDIPTASKLNLLGRLVHRFDQGAFIRSVETYRRLYSSLARIENEETFRSGVCDYYAAVLVR